MSKILDIRLHQDTFLSIQFDCCMFKNAEAVSQNLNMVLINRLFESIIVEVKLNFFNWLQNLLNYFLKNCKCRGDSEADTIVAVDFIVSCDDYMLFGLFVKLHLKISVR